MSVLNKLACSLGRRDEVLNQKLARELADSGDVQAIKEIAENLCNRDKNIAGDCVKVLYEIGYLNPGLITDYADEFVRLLVHKNNRMVWGAMIALSTISGKRPDLLYPHVAGIQKAMQTGSVITVDAAVKTLAGISAGSEKHEKKVFPFLLEHLKKCRPKEVPQHAESVLPAVNAKNKKAFIRVMRQRMEDMTSSQAARLKRVLKRVEGVA